MNQSHRETNSACFGDFSVQWLLKTKNYGLHNLNIAATTRAIKETKKKSFGMKPAKRVLYFYQQASKKNIRENSCYISVSLPCGTND